MYTIGTHIFRIIKNRKAQILLPSVLLAPIFVLVIYLLFETAKVSMTKVRQQFALDNAAYSQMSSVSTYLNAVAMVNGPLPYRVFAAEFTSGAFGNIEGKNGEANTTVYELFYKGGGFPGAGKDADRGASAPPKPESVDWNVHYYDGEEVEPDFPRTAWEKETPSPLDEDKKDADGKEGIPINSRKLVENHYFPATKLGIQAIVNYLTDYITLGGIYEPQKYAYEDVIKHSFMFREAYFLNVNDCKRSECARQSASKIGQFLKIKTIPMELNKMKFYVSDSQGMMHGGAYAVSITAEETLEGKKLFQFAYLDPSSKGKLNSLSRGVMLKQTFGLPKNHFNINLEKKYKPYVRNRVILSCPRSGNNCVWPNPLPKYNVILRP